MLFPSKAILPIVTTDLLFIWLVYFVTLLMHHLPRRLQPSIGYLLLREVLLGLSHGCLLLLLHLEHLFLVLQIYRASFHLQGRQRIQVTSPLCAYSRPDLEPWIPIAASSETWYILHQVLLLVVLLGHEGWRFGHASESVALVQGLLHCFVPFLVWGVVLILHEFTEVQGLTWPVEISFAASASDWLVDLLVVEVSETRWLSKTASGTEVRTIHIRTGERHHQVLNVSLIDSILLLHLLEQFVVFALLLKKYDPLLIVSLPSLKVSDLLVLQHGLLVHLLDPVLQLLVLLNQQLSIVSNFGITVVVDQFLQLVDLDLQLLVLDGVVLHQCLLLTKLDLAFVHFFTLFPQLTALLLQHVWKQFNLLVLVGDNLRWLFLSDVALWINHCSLLLGLVLLFQHDEVLLLQRIVFFLQFANLLLQLLDLLQLLLIDLEKSMVLIGFLVCQLGLPFLNLDDASEEAFVLLEDRGTEIVFLHKVDVLHLSGHRLILVGPVGLQAWQVKDLLGVWQLSDVVAFVQLTHLPDDGHPWVILSQRHHLWNCQIACTPPSVMENLGRLFELWVLAFAPRKGCIDNVFLKLSFNGFDHFEWGCDLVCNHLVTVNGEVEAGLGTPRWGVDPVLGFIAGANLGLDVLQLELVARLV